MIVNVTTSQPAALLVILGPYYWGSSTFPGLAPGDSRVFAYPLLDGVGGPAQQQLQSLTVTAVPLWDTIVQSLGVSSVRVIGEPNGRLDVNFLVTNTHATSHCYGFKFWFAMIVP